MTISTSSSRGIPISEVEGRHDYENEAVFRRNCLPQRSYHIPETALNLNGKWEFHYALTPAEAPEPGSHTQRVTDSAASPKSWSHIEDPGHWQLQGWGHPHYINVQLPIPACPPYVPTENPTGTYRRTFYVPTSWEPDSQLRLRFDGVDSAYHVWVNGVLVGYAQGSRNASEFDVSGYVDRNGPNELSVRVYQWSDGTYIEDQDQWWLSGIYRDVFLIAFPADCRIEDWFIRTDLDSNYQDATIQATVDIAATEGGTLKLTLRKLARYGGDVIGTAEASVDPNMPKIDLSLAVLSPQKWTAETPYLYGVELSLTIGSKTHTIHQNIGFCKVELLKGLISVNGKPIRIRGVNRHDHHPTLGRAVSVDYIRRDLLLMKANNINSIRCSHYPSHPKLFDLADKLGFWIMDEADLECHGFSRAVMRPLDLPKDMPYEQRREVVFTKAAKYTSDNPTWKGAYLDRLDSMLHRDKNHPSIIFWSLGNESFYGQNHKAMYERARTLDPGRLVHYEGDIEAETTDMYSYMYWPADDLVRMANTVGIKDGAYEKPIVLCEYVHAMGNGPGLLQDYEKAFSSHLRLQGGWVWEWSNHGLWKSEDGKGFFAYGGDFGDYPNDGTFSMAGLCNSTHEPGPGVAELKKVIEPVKLSLDGSDHVVVHNLYDFVGLDHLVATYTVEELGAKSIVLADGELDLPTVEAGGTAKVALPRLSTGFKRPHEIVLTVALRLRQRTPWADIGHEVAWLQAPLVKAEQHSLATLPRLSQAYPTAKIVTQSLGTILKVSGLDWSFEFDRARGHLKRWTSGNSALLKPDPSTGAALVPSFWRPPTDNDGPKAVPYWQRYGVDELKGQLRSFEVSNVAGNVMIEVASFVSPPVLDWGWKCRCRYTINDKGSLEVAVDLHPEGAFPEHVPRVGLNLNASRSLDKVRWCGLGPGESYPDKRGAQRLGIWSVDTVSDLHVPYEVPQETGNRMQTRWAAFTDTQGQRLRAHMNARSKDKEDGGADVADFSWAASRFSARAIQDAKHPCDLVEESATLVRLDAKVAGVGTAACGPSVREEDLVHVQPMKFSFLLEHIRG
ncbi:Beta-galactosidase (Lactase) [Neonectria punicea]|uniref:Lactase n=1 Tax=Neonectria punicea TaxID=979145 RepID=A0ABR1HJQ0_9HYPO